MFVSRGMGEAFEGGGNGKIYYQGVSREGEERLTMLTLPVC